MLVNGGLDILINNLQGGNNVINYLAISDTTDNILQVSDTKLKNEFFRKQITNIERVDNSIVITTFIDMNEAVGNWKEIGLFSNATSTLNSGTLVAKAFINEEKTNLKTSTIIWEIKFERS